MTKFTIMFHDMPNQGLLPTSIRGLGRLIVFSENAFLCLQLKLLL